MRMGETILGGLVLVGAALVGYVCVEFSLRLYFTWRRRPPLPLPQEISEVKEKESRTLPPSGGRFWWKVFPGNHPGCWFEIRTEEGHEDNFERFREWIHKMWGHSGEPPEEWWDEAEERISHVLEKARATRTEIEVAEFRRSLEDL